MILKVDVAHPALAHKVREQTSLQLKYFSHYLQDQNPSIATIVASVDPRASQYDVEFRVQDSGQNKEVIQDMKNVVNILLQKFNEITSKKPQSRPW